MLLLEQIKIENGDVKHINIEQFRWDSAKLESAFVLGQGAKTIDKKLREPTMRLQNLQKMSNWFSDVL